MRKQASVPMTKVIRDCRDATMDYEMPIKAARFMYKAGRLHWDLNNHAYCHPESGGRIMTEAAQWAESHWTGK